MTNTTTAPRLIDQARSNGGVLDFTTGAGTGNTLNTKDALVRAGHTVVRTGGVWQSKGGIQWRLTLTN